ncbi:MAG: hypothetical protein KDE23_02725 [Caldilinea sp.]|nr:hypothetical protein [Caldilinea sp.]
MDQSPLDPTALYTARLARAEAEHAQQDASSRRLGNVNLILFFGAFAVLAVGAFRGDGWIAALGGLLFVAFVAGLVLRSRTERRLQAIAARVAIAREGLARLRRDWRALPDPVPPTAAALLDNVQSAGAPPIIDAATAADLDLLGHASLEHLLGTANTAIGRATVRRWILQPAAPAVARARQAAAAELAPQLDFREEVAVRGRLLEMGEDRYARFVAWAEGEPWLHSHRRWIWVARLLPLLMLALFVGWLAGYPLLWPLLGSVALNLFILQSVGRKVSDDINRVAAQQGVFEAYAALFERVTAHPVTAPALRDVQARLGTGKLSADRQMRRLARLMPLVDIRRSIYFFPVEVATLWSFHVLWLLENWQRTAGAHVRAWLEALGEAEALAALAALRFEQPDWAFPELSEATDARVTATALAHPLLPPERAVGNDVIVGPPDSYLLVTGSNMSGKSTLLRAIGVNAVLAQMGAPVCAAQLSLPPVSVISSMRVQDSLEAGVSFYMAELRRLKAIVDRADARQPGEPLLLYLLDEILQGTNTAERQIAARHIIRHLIDRGAIGAVSTHDLTLADAPELRPAAQMVYFTEHFTRSAAGPTMTFDYRLRPGLAISTNALKLMEIIGLPIKDADAARADGAPLHPAKPGS